MKPDLRVLALLVLAGCGVPTAASQPTRRTDDPARPGNEPLVVLPSLPAPPVAHDFESAKRALELRVHDTATTRVDVYCGCPYDEHKQVDLAHCASAHPYEPIEVHRARANRMEWEHVVPASWIGRPMACWSEPTTHSHRDHCREVSPAFRSAEGDMHNLLPSVGQMNALRDDDAYGEIAGEERIAGCDFELDSRAHRVEPRDEARGELARATFYVSAVYRVGLRRSLYETLRRWHRDDPPTALERERNDRIERLQGNRNPYVDGTGALP